MAPNGTPLSEAVSASHQNKHTLPGKSTVKLFELYDAEVMFTVLSDGANLLKAASETLPKYAYS